MILLAEETQRIDIDRDVRVFTVVTLRVSWGTNISEIFLRDRETIVAVSVRNWRGCFQPMIDVKDALIVMLSGFVRPCNSTQRESVVLRGSPYISRRSLSRRKIYWSNNLIATPQYEDHVTGVRPSI